MMVFLEVVDGRSFTVAADRLGRTKSAVSQSVTRLEADLDCRLLYRSTRSLSLTQAGTRFYTHCQSVKSVYDHALDDLQSSMGEPSGLLTVTAPHALCAAVVGPALARFMDMHPRMRARLIAEDAQIDLIGAQVDLAVRVGQPKEQTAHIARLGTLDESLYASPDYIAGQGATPETLVMLADWDHIANDWQGDPVTYRAGDGSYLRVSPRARCSALPDILQLAERGLGVALLPDIAARDSVAKNGLTRLFAVNSTPVYSMHHLGKRPPRKVQSFVKLLRAELRQNPAG